MYYLEILKLDLCCCSCFYTAGSHHLPRVLTNLCAFGMKCTNNKLTKILQPQMFPKKSISFPKGGAAGWTMLVGGLPACCGKPYFIYTSFTSSVRKWSRRREAMINGQNRGLYQHYGKLSCWSWSSMQDTSRTMIQTVVWRLLIVASVRVVHHLSA